MSIDITDGGTGQKPSSVQRSGRQFAPQPRRREFTKLIPRETPEIRATDSSQFAAMEGLANTLGDFFGVRSRVEEKEAFERDKKRNEEEITKMRMKILANPKGARDALATGDFSEFTSDNEMAQRRVIQDAFMRMTATENALTDYLEGGRDEIDQLPAGGDARDHIQSTLGHRLKEAHPAYAESYANAYIKASEKQVADWYENRHAMITNKAITKGEQLARTAFEMGHVTSIDNLESLTQQIASVIPGNAVVAYDTAQGAVDRIMMQTATGGGEGAEDAIKLLDMPDPRFNGQRGFDRLKEDYAKVAAAAETARKNKAGAGFHVTLNKISDDLAGNQISPVEALVRLRRAATTYGADGVPVSSWNPSYVRVYNQITSGIKAQGDWGNALSDLANGGLIPPTELNKRQKIVWGGILDGRLARDYAAGSSISFEDAQIEALNYGLKLGIDAESAKILTRKMLSNSMDDYGPLTQLMNVVSTTNTNPQMLFSKGVDGDIAYAKYVMLSMDPSQGRAISARLNELRQKNPEITPKTVFNEIRESNDTAFNLTERNEIVDEVFNTVYDPSFIPFTGKKMQSNATQAFQARAKYLLGLAVYMNYDKALGDSMDEAKEMLALMYKHMGYVRNTASGKGIVDIKQWRPPRKLADGTTAPAFMATHEEQVEAGDQLEDAFPGTFVTDGGEYPAMTVMSETTGMPMTLGTLPGFVDWDSVPDILKNAPGLVKKEMEDGRVAIYMPAPEQGQSGSKVLMESEDFVYKLTYNEDSREWLITAHHNRVATTPGGITQDFAIQRNKLIKDNKAKVHAKELWGKIFDPDLSLDEREAANEEFKEKYDRYPMDPREFERLRKIHDRAKQNGATKSLWEQLKDALTFSGRATQGSTNEGVRKSQLAKPAMNDTGAMPALIAGVDRVNQQQGLDVYGSAFDGDLEKGDESSLIGILSKHLMRAEGGSLKAYNDRNGKDIQWSKSDQKRGNPTIGYGFNMNRRDARRRLEGLGFDYDKLLSGEQEINETAARRLLKDTMNESINAIRIMYQDVPLKDHHIIALASLHFNSPNLVRPGTRLHKALLHGDLKAAAYEIRHKSVDERGMKRRGDGHLIRGLKRRRESEASIFEGDINRATSDQSNREIPDTNEKKLDVMMGSVIDPGTLESWASDAMDVASEAARAGEKVLNSASKIIAQNALRVASMAQDVKETGTEVADSVVDIIKDYLTNIGVEATHAVLESVTPTDSSRMLVSDFIAKNTMGIPMNKKLLTSSDLRPINYQVLQTMGHKAWKMGKRGITWKDYGEDALGNKVSGIIGGTGVKGADKAYPKTAKGFAKLGMMTLLDPKVDLALTIGQASLKVEGGRLYATDVYDGEKFKFGSRSQGIYGWLRDFFFQEGRGTLEGGKNAGIKWKIDLGPVER